MTRRTLARRLLRELAYVVVLGSPVLVFFLVALPRSHAAQLLRQLRAVQVSHTPFQRVEQLAAQYGGNAACLGDNCLFEFQNTWLQRLRLAPATQFSVMLQRRGSPSDPGGGEVGALDMAMLVSRGASRAGDGGAIASALVFDRAGAGPYRASITFGPDGRPGRTVVTLAAGATPAQRAQARAFNLACLTKLGGCRTSRQLLPEVWQGAQRIQSAGAQAAPSKWVAAAAMSGASH